MAFSLSPPALFCPITRPLMIIREKQVNTGLNPLLCHHGEFSFMTDAHASKKVILLKGHIYMPTCGFSELLIKNSISLTGVTLIYLFS